LICDRHKALDTQRRRANVSMRRPLRHLFGDSIGLLLVHIVRCADLELGLQSQFFCAALLAFAGGTRAFAAAGALALQHAARSEMSSHWSSDRLVADRALQLHPAVRRGDGCGRQP
jgi:hypothetical protein